MRYAFNCFLVNRGYVLLDLDYRGSSGYGRDWRTGVYLQMGGPDLEDVLGGVDYLRSLGNIDMQRVGIWGSSYGGGHVVVVAGTDDPVRLARQHAAAP